MSVPLSLQRLASVSRKEFLHILRDPMTLFFTLFIPIVELFMLGYAIDTNVRHVHTVVYNQARTQESRDLLQQFQNSEDFLVVGEVFTDLALSEAIIASTRDAAMQLSMGTVMPSIFLSGYVFPLDSMPAVFWYIAQIIPTTWMIDAARGVILRGAGWQELKLHSLVLWGMALGVLVFSTLKFRKRLA
jgi:hypothetical protein